MPTYDTILDAPMCKLGACFAGDTLTRLDFLATNVPVLNSTDARVRRLADDLDAYWGNPAHVFSLKLLPVGTRFQQKVWRALTQIAPGRTTTYGLLANQLGTSARAVGQACGSNPLPIFIPCHRVLAATGLGGFMHSAAKISLDIKVWLLTHETPPLQP